MITIYENILSNGLLPVFFPAAVLAVGILIARRLRTLRGYRSDMELLETRVPCRLMQGDRQGAYALCHLSGGLAGGLLGEAVAMSNDSSDDRAHLCRNCAFAIARLRRELLLVSSVPVLALIIGTLRTLHSLTGNDEALTSGDFLMILLLCFVSSLPAAVIMVIFFLTIGGLISELESVRNLYEIFRPNNGRTSCAKNGCSACV